VTASTLLIDVDSLAQALQAEGVTLLDARWRLGGPPGRNEYLAGHIPHAVFVDIDADVCGPPGQGGRHPLPDRRGLQEALRRAGVTNDKPVVVYDFGDGMAAARTWWTLRWAGHPDVRVLDGGFPAWQRAGLPIEAGHVEAAAGDFTVRPGQMRVIDSSGAAAQPATGVLLDARAPQRFRGETEPIDPVAGRVPGARNVPYADLVEPDGRLRTADELRARFALAGISHGTDTAAYCGSGVTAAHTVLALTVAGIDDPGLYVGSWSEWLTDPSRPVAVGEDT
jgi:thiosulfate/3-mercaptopyruvate sulfurtransferase